MTVSRDQLVLEVPLVGVGLDLVFGEAAELVAHHVEGLVVEAGVAEMPVGDEQIGDAHAHRIAVCPRGKGA